MKELRSDPYYLPCRSENKFGENCNVHLQVVGSRMVAVEVVCRRGTNLVDQEGSCHQFLRKGPHLRPWSVVCSATNAAEAALVASIGLAQQTL